MRKLTLLAMLSATTVLSIADPKPKTTLLFSLRGHSVRDPALSSDGRRIYYVQDTSQVYVFDRVTRQSVPVIGSTPGIGASLAISPAGDRLAYTRKAEDGDDRQLWTVTLDPATGLPKGAPRRVGILAASSPAFSPDGKSIAFATPTSRTAANLVVIPANGGPERVVAETQGDIWPIVWAKSDSIYFGGAFQGKQNASKNGVYRVSVSNAKPQFLLRTADWGSYPGLSPDGRFILAFDTTWDSVFVATASGKRLRAYQPKHGETTPDVWAGGGKAIGWRQAATKIVHVVDIATKQDRAVSDSGEYTSPEASEDGSHVAAIRAGPAELVVFDVNSGKSQRISPDLLPGPTAAIHWSPNGRSIAFRNNHDGGIHIIDLATSKERRVAAKSTLGPLARWRRDSRAFMYAVAGPPENTDSMRTITVHEVPIDGPDRVLRSLDTRCSGGQFCGKIVDDSLLSTWINGEYRVTNIRARGAPRLAYKRTGATPQMPVPAFSANGRWMAVRRQSASDQRESIELMRPDGSAQRSIPVSFRLAPGGHNPWIRDDGAELIVASPDCSESPSLRCRGGLTFYRVDVATGKTTPLVSIPHSIRQIEDSYVSPDGRSVVYMAEIESRVDFYDFDFTELLKPARP